MLGLPIVLVIALCGAILALAALVLFLSYCTARYGPVIERIFELRPVFAPLHITPEDLGELVRFKTDDGIELAGSYLPRRTAFRIGQLVFCHEFLSNRFSYLPYLESLRDIGYDIFTFDFRNHGKSGSDPAYTPMQWATDFEVRDLRAALRYLRSRDNHDTAGFALFGVSRGGSTALAVAAEEPDVWAVVTDGAFPTRGTMTAYIIRWAAIYVNSQLFLLLVPRWMYAIVGCLSLLRTQRKLNCRFPDIETAARLISPRPWLLIHGQRDAYISPEIAQSLFAKARQPKEMWLVPDAKHNHCREFDPEAYAATITDFLSRSAPRRPVEAFEPLAQTSIVPFPVGSGLPVGVSRVASGVATPLAT
ncbi:MAG: alpha/beta hydrolase [Planctomycetaceae bacterium]|nr:alpha/beta hydrolase [Planctomycetaceae bacterium]